MLNNAVRTFFVALASTVIGLTVAAMATTASPALASTPFAPHAYVSVI